MDAVAAPERDVMVGVRGDELAGLELGRHGANDGAALRVEPSDEVVHEWHGQVREPLPAGTLREFDVRPVVVIAEDQDHGFGVVVDVLVLLLPNLLLAPDRLLQRNDGIGQRRRIDVPEIPDRRPYVHKLDSRSTATNLGGWCV